MRMIGLLSRLLFVPHLPLIVTALLCTRSPSAERLRRRRTIARPRKRNASRTTRPSPARSIGSFRSRARTSRERRSRRARRAFVARAIAVGVSPESPAFRFRGGGRRRRARRPRGIVLGTFRDGLGASDDGHGSASLGRQQHVRPREVDPHPRPQNAQHEARAAGHAVRSHRRPRASEWTVSRMPLMTCEISALLFFGTRRASSSVPFSARVPHNPWRGLA